jgi:hypothetical protein
MKSLKGVLTVAWLSGNSTILDVKWKFVLDATSEA